MYAMGDTHRMRIRLWSDWLLVAAGLVALCVLLDQVSDVAFNNDTGGEVRVGRQQGPQGG